jgi:hypothetical protein
MNYKKYIEVKMSKWIDLNLPYAINNVKTLEIPDLSKFEIEEFGSTISDIIKSFSQNDEKDVAYYNTKSYMEFEDMEINLEELVKKEICGEQSIEESDEDYLNRCDLKQDDINRELDARIIKLNLPIYKKICLVRGQFDWKHKKLEQLGYYEANEKYMESQTINSFCGRGLNNPGTLIEVEENGKLSEYLIGDINVNCGVCNDCVAFNSNAIVKRYKIVWTKK